MSVRTEYEVVQYDITTYKQNGRGPKLVAIVRPYGDIRLRVTIGLDASDYSHRDGSPSYGGGVARVESWSHASGRWNEILARPIDELAVSGIFYQFDLDEEDLYRFDDDAVTLIEAALKIVLT